MYPLKTLAIYASILKFQNLPRQFVPEQVRKAIGGPVHQAYTFDPACDSCQANGASPDHSMAHGATCPWP